MKNVIIFLFGAVCGAGGMFLWLRKDIKDRLENASETHQNDDELPFETRDENIQGNGEKCDRSDSEGSESDSGNDISDAEKIRTDYHKIVNAVKTGEQPVLKIPVLPREDIPEVKFDDQTNDILQELDMNGPEVKEIDRDEYDHDDGFEKEHLVYFQDDRIVSTEHGTIIKTPAILIGTNWDEYVGHYAKRTAFVRNSRLSIDYEILVEDGSYEDEYGPYDPPMED